MNNLQPNDSSMKRQGEGSRGQGEMTPSPCSGAEQNMDLNPPLLLSASRSGGVESPSELSPLHGSAAVRSLASLSNTPLCQEKTALFFIPSEDANISRLTLILYLVPVIGFFPSLWTLYFRQGSREQLNLSRLSITLALTWLSGYILLATGAVSGEFFSLRVLLLNSFLTSGYFLVSVWLIVRTVQGKTNRLAGFSRFANRISHKYLS